LWLWLKSRGLNSILEKIKPKEMIILFGLIHRSILQRLKEETGFEDEDSDNARKDMFHFLFHAKDIETGRRAYQDNELAGEASVLLSTALGGTSTTLAAFFFYITRNPHVYRKLVEEIRCNFASSEDIDSGGKISACY
jgi:cytochrome P450